MPEEEPIIYYMPQIVEPQWPIEARTLDEAFAILRRPGRWLTRAEMELLYPPNAENS